MAALNANQVQADWQSRGRLPIDAPHRGTQTTADLVPDHRRAHLPGQGVANPGRPNRRVGQEPNPEHPISDANTFGTQPSERQASSQPLDQAASLFRLRRRRALMIARPLLVFIRCRNPCRRARRCTFGWYVRFTNSSKGRGVVCSGCLTSASLLPTSPLRYGLFGHHDNHLAKPQLRIPQLPPQRQSQLPPHKPLTCENSQPRPCTGKRELLQS